MGEEEELPPSKLGTKDHWDSVYESVSSAKNEVARADAV